MNSEGLIWLVVGGIAAFFLFEYMTKSQGITMPLPASPLLLPSCPQGQMAYRTALGMGPWACAPAGTLS